MKIAHIAPPWLAIPPKNYGGTEIVLYNLVEEQVAQGHDVTLFAPGDAHTSAQLVSFYARSLIDTGNPWQGHLKAFYHLYKSVEYIGEHHYDIVHAHLSSSSDMYVFPLTSRLSTPMVTTLHSRFPFDRVDDWCGDADTYYLEWLASTPLIAISNTARAEVPFKNLDFMGVVHHGVPMNVFRAPATTVGDYLVWLGRFVPEKGPHLAIQAAKATGRRLVLAGTIDRYVPASVSYFENVIKPQIDGEQISYIGPVDMQQKIDLLSRAYAFLNPIGWEEPFGMVMIEAMALGCPVIAFSRGAAPEIVAHGKSGYLIQTIEEMIQTIPLLAELDRREVRRHVEHNFSAYVMAEKYVKYYRKAISSHLLELSLPKLDIVEKKAQPFPTTYPRRQPASPASWHAPSVAADPHTEMFPPLSVKAKKRDADSLS